MKGELTHGGSVYKVPSLDYSNVGKGYIYYCLPRGQVRRTGVPEIGFSGALPTVETWRSISGTERQTVSARTPNFQKH